MMSIIPCDFSQLEEELKELYKRAGRPWPEKPPPPEKPLTAQEAMDQVSALMTEMGLEPWRSQEQLRAQLQVVSMATVVPQPVRWLWQDKIPLGKVTVIYGEPGIGKSNLVLDLAARVSTGTNWPDGSSGPEAGKVLILNSEDPFEDTLSPRLLGAKASMENISVCARLKLSSPEPAPLDPHGEMTDEREFDLSRDLPVLRRWIQSLNGVRLLILDSLESFCGPTGMRRSRMRMVLAELARLAASEGIAIVVTSNGTKCDLPVKNVWRVDCDHLDSGLRCLVPVRCNHSVLPTGMGFRLIGEGLTWEDRGPAPTADRVRGTTPKQERERELKEHAAWLREVLEDGPCAAKKVQASAQAAGWSMSQLKRAKQALRVRCYKESRVKGRWMWELPPRPPGPVVGRMHFIGDTLSASDGKVLDRLNGACGRVVHNSAQAIKGGEEVKEVGL